MNDVVFGSGFGWVRPDPVGPGPRVPGPPEYPVTAQDYRDFEALKARLIVLTTKLGQAAGSLPPEEQVQLRDHLREKLTAFDQ